MKICKILFNFVFAGSLLLSGTDRDDSILIRNDDLVVDDYQKPLVRDGSPEYVKRIVVPGAMNGSLVGLYKKDAVLDPFKKTFSLKVLRHALIYQTKQNFFSKIISIKISSVPYIA